MGRTLTMPQNDPHLPYRLLAVNVPRYKVDEIVEEIKTATTDIHIYIRPRPYSIGHDERTREEIEHITLTKI